MNWIIFSWELFSAKNMPLIAREIFNPNTVLHARRSSIFLTLRTKVNDFPNAAKLFAVLPAKNQIALKMRENFGHQKLVRGTSLAAF